MQKIIAILVVFLIPVILMAQDQSTEQQNEIVSLREEIISGFAEENISAKILQNRYLEFGDSVFDDLVIEKLKILTNDNLEGKTFDLNTEEGEGDVFQYYLNYEKSGIKLRNKSKSNGYALAEKNIITSEQIEENISKDLEAFGLMPDDPTLDIKVTNVMRAGVRTEKDGAVTNIPGTAIADVAYIYRNIDNMRVYDQRMILEYYLDGTLKYVSSRWPNIEQKTHVLNDAKSENEIVERVNWELSHHTLGQDGEPLKFELGLRIQNGSLRHTIRVTRKFPKVVNDITNRTAVLEVIL